MKFEIEISDEKLKERVTELVANETYNRIFSPPHHLNYDDRNKWEQKKREEIVKAIDWKNASSKLSEKVIEMFFVELLGKRK